MDAHTIEVLSLAAEAKRNAWPCAGGVGDQTVSFRSAAAFIRAEHAALEADEYERRANRH